MDQNEYIGVCHGYHVIKIIQGRLGCLEQKIYLGFRNLNGPLEKKIEFTNWSRINIEYKLLSVGLISHQYIFKNPQVNFPKFGNVLNF